MRYQLLPYLYTLFYQANQINGAPVARSLWMNFPSDSATLTINTQFMLGDAVLVSPVLTQGATTVTAYFPAALWYSFSDRALSVDASNAATIKILDAPLTVVNVHIQGGTVLPLQEAAMTTTAGRLTPFTLLAALSTSGSASGSLFWDDGEQIDLDYYLTVSYTVSSSSSSTSSSGSITAVIDSNTYSAASSSMLQTITVMGTSSQFSTTPLVVNLNGNTLDSNQISYDESKHSITFTNLNLSITDVFTLNWE